MKLSNKHLAFICTALVFVFAVIVGFAIKFTAENVSPQVFFFTIIFGFFAWMFYILYTIILAKLDYEDGKHDSEAVKILKEMNQKVDK